MRERHQQHHRLGASLKAYGYGVSVLPIILGFCGTTPNFAVEAVHTLGMEKGRADKLQLVLHVHASTILHTTVTLRGKLEGCFKNRRRHRYCLTGSSSSKMKPLIGSGTPLVSPGPPTIHACRIWQAAKHMTFVAAITREDGCRGNSQAIGDICTSGLSVTSAPFLSNNAHVSCVSLPATSA